MYNARMLTKQDLLNSYQHVVDNASFVTIDNSAIDQFVHNFSPAQALHWSEACPFEYHPQATLEEELDMLFLLSNQAFYYWGTPKWHMEYQGQKYDGWWGAIACFQKAVEKGVPILEGEYLANLTLEQTQQLFAGEPEIPLLKERHEMLSSIGKTLVEKYQGRFHNFFAQASKDPVELTVQIAETFAGFDDVPTYKGKSVYFYKKAQLAVSDFVYNPLKLPTGVSNTNDLTGWADYKIPANLRQLGILVYTDDLANRVDNKVLIPEKSEEEIEIRASQLIAVDRIVQKLKPKYPNADAIFVQLQLWVTTQASGSLSKPYHLTPTIYY